MKKYILILTILLGSVSFSFAQDQAGEGAKQQEKIQALYVAYVTQQLKLTPDEAQKFWPLHTQFDNDLRGVNKDLPELTKQQARLDIKKKYQDGFSKVIGANRCERFYTMGDAFRRKLLDKVQKQRADQRRPPVRRRQ